MNSVYVDDWTAEQAIIASNEQWRIQNFPEGDAPTPKILLFCKYFAENCMKMKEFGPPGTGAPGTPMMSHVDDWTAEWAIIASNESCEWLDSDHC